MTVPIEVSQQDIAGLRIPSRSRELALHKIANALDKRRPLRVAFANTHLAYHALRDSRLRSALARFYLLNDGIGMSLLSALRGGAGFAANLNGTDLTPELLARLPGGARVFLVGAKPDVIFRAADAVRRLAPQLHLCAAYDGYSARTTRKLAVFADLRRTAPQLVLVGMGNPLQEQWILEAERHAPTAVFMGVGALFDFLARPATRAPTIVRRLRLEWLHRLLHEPRRMLRRYTVEVAVLSIACLRDRLRDSTR